MLGVGAWGSDGVYRVKGVTVKTSVYLGTDGGATTSKVGGVRHDGTVVSTRLLQRPTNATHGPGAMVAGWIAAACDYLAAND